MRVLISRNGKWRHYAGSAGSGFGSWDLNFLDRISLGVCLLDWVIWSRYIELGFIVGSPWDARKPLCEGLRK
jgi:hypothetical protein